MDALVARFSSESALSKLASTIEGIRCDDSCNSLQASVNSLRSVISALASLRDLETVVAVLLRALVLKIVPFRAREFFERESFSMNRNVIFDQLLEIAGSASYRDRTTESTSSSTAPIAVDAVGGRGVLKCHFPDKSAFRTRDPRGRRVGMRRIVSVRVLRTRSGLSGALELLL